MAAAADALATILLMRLMSTVCASALAASAEAVGADAPLLVMAVWKASAALLSLAMLTRRAVREVPEAAAAFTWGGKKMGR